MSSSRSSTRSPSTSRSRARSRWRVRDQYYRRDRSSSQSKHKSTPKSNRHRRSRSRASPSRDNGRQRRRRSPSSSSSSPSPSSSRSPARSHSREHGRPSALAQSSVQKSQPQPQPPGKSLKEIEDELKAVKSQYATSKAKLDAQVASLEFQNQLISTSERELRSKHSDSMQRMMTYLANAADINAATDTCNLPGSAPNTLGAITNNVVRFYKVIKLILPPKVMPTQEEYVILSHAIRDMDYRRNGEAHASTRPYVCINGMNPKAKKDSDFKLHWVRHYKISDFNWMLYAAVDALETHPRLASLRGQIMAEMRINVALGGVPTVLTGTIADQTDGWKARAPTRAELLEKSRLRLIVPHAPTTI